MAAARDQGKLLGRPRRLTADGLAEAERRLVLGETHEAVARALGMAWSTLYRGTLGGETNKVSKDRFWTPIFAGIVGGFLSFCLLTVFHSALIMPLSTSHGWSALGTMATLTGLLAAIFGIGLAAIMAFQWSQFEGRVDQRVKQETARLERSLNDSFGLKLQALGELAVTLSAGMLPQGARLTGACTG